MTFARGMTIAAVALMGISGCTVKKQETPELTGPSELGLSLAITATPDVLTMDGVAQSTIIVRALNANSQPVSNLGLRAEIQYGGELVDLGRLSTRTASTGSDGRASFVYTAPQSPSLGSSDDGNGILTIRIIPSGGDYSNAWERTVDIRLVPQGIILPRPYTPVSRFVYSPDTGVEGQPMQFDGSLSRDVIECPSGATTIDTCTTSTATLVDYKWDFGDGHRSSGIRSQHAYDTVGSYTVTLTVTNASGIAASSSQFVKVGVSSNPVPTFAFSPANPIPGDTVFFNASGSTAAPGRTLVRYSWTFGDGTGATGGVTSHRYPNAGDWVVTLNVTDDLGKAGAISRTVSVKP